MPNSDSKPWERMRQLVAVAIEGHPMFDGLPEPPVVEASRYGVLLRSGRVCAELHGHEWWLPLNESRAFRLAGDLSVQLRARLDGADAGWGDRKAG